MVKTPRVRNEFDKVVMIGGSYNTGVWGRIPHPPEENGASRAEDPTLRRFLQFFFPKNTNFKHTLV